MIKVFFLRLLLTFHYLLAYIYSWCISGYAPKNVLIYMRTIIRAALMKQRKTSVWLNCKWSWTRMWMLVRCLLASQVAIVNTFLNKFVRETYDTRQKFVCFTLHFQWLQHNFNATISHGSHDWRKRVVYAGSPNMYDQLWLRL